MGTMPGGVIEVRRSERLGVSERLWVSGLLRAFWVAARHFFRGPKRAEAASPAPQRMAAFERSTRVRGMPVLVVDAGVARCIGCGLCAEICPPVCIRVLPPLPEASSAHLAGEGEAAVHGPPALFEIDMARCFSCGLCEEVCPADALAMSPLVEIAASERNDLVFGFDALLVPAASLRDRVPTREPGWGGGRICTK